METTFTQELVLSVLIFAPGVFLLAFGLFMGVLMGLERAGVFGSTATRRDQKKVADKTV